MKSLQKLNILQPKARVSATESSIPSGVDENAVFAFLDDLRESDIINMFGATPYIEDEFGVDKQTSRTLLIEWMDQFTLGKPSRKTEADADMNFIPENEAGKLPTDVPATGIENDNESSDPQNEDEDADDELPEWTIKYRAVAYQLITVHAHNEDEALNLAEDRFELENFEFDYDSIDVVDVDGEEAMSDEDQYLDKIDRDYDDESFEEA